MAGPTLAQARSRLWREAGFGPTGGYDDPWQDAVFAGIPYAVPNCRSRAQALRVHDLHHVLTGYGTDWRGESEIAAWELASGGGGRYAYAWFIAVFGFVVGLLALPRRTFRAFERGRGAANLYAAAEPMAMLHRDVAAARNALGIEAPVRRNVVGVLAFVGWAVAALPAGLIAIAGTPVLVLAALTRCGGCPLLRGGSAT